MLMTVKHRMHSHRILFILLEEITPGFSQIVITILNPSCICVFMHLLFNSKLEWSIWGILENWDLLAALSDTGKGTQVAQWLVLSGSYLQAPLLQWAPEFILQAKHLCSATQPCKPWEDSTAQHRASSG